MSNIERMGIAAEWTKRRKSNKFLSDHKRIVAAADGSTIGDLEYYVKHGVDRPGEFDYLIKKPAYEKGWESSLDSRLGTYALYRVWEFEANSIESGKFDVRMAQRAMSACRLAEMIAAASYRKALDGIAGRRVKLLHMQYFPYAALGLIIGHQKEALQLAKLQLLAHRKARIEYPTSFPVFHCMMRILADHLGEQPHVPILAGPAESAGEALYRAWREPDPAVIAPLCLAMLDLHTHLTAFIDDGVMREFGSQWEVTPIEILFLFKLRELRGLQNPVLEHPLMNSSLGILPVEFEDTPDDLVERVRSRMVLDGFDEGAIVAEWGIG